MNIKEACKILDIKDEATPLEVDKAFKKMALQYHPDKPTGSSEMFAKISSAYKFLKENGTKIPAIPFSGFPNISEFFQKKQDLKSDSVNFGEINISFIESITGVTKSVNIKKKCTDLKCKICDGFGIKSLDTCTECHGDGVSFTGKFCNSCVGAGIIQVKCDCVMVENSLTNLVIPPGVISGDVLTIEGAAGNLKDIILNASFSIVVLDDAEFKRNGDDVLSSINITLLESLEGCTKDVKTCYGTKILKIKPRIRHGDVIKAKNLGVRPHGSHMFNICVDYPSDDILDKVVKVLKESDAV